MHRESAENFIASLKSELAEIDLELAAREPLLKRRALVVGLLEQTQTLIGQKQSAASVAKKSAKKADSKPSKVHGTILKRHPRFVGTVPEAMERVLVRHHRYMTAADIFHALVAEEAWKPTAAGREVVRGNLIRRHDTFSRDGKTFGLVRWGLVDGSEGRNGGGEDRPMASA